ncbi:MAG TPA: ATP-binding protein [Gaiellaceae bacterium]|nr:ATP-binding protein [Gaiellaceae bacterium]
MSDAAGREPTFIGFVVSVQGSVIRARLRKTPSTLVMVGGESYRVGQIGAFVRIPLGYTQLYGVCTQVGADAAPSAAQDAASLFETDDDEELPEGYRWLTLVLFGESVGGHFDRGVGQYPTVGDEVHLVLPADLETIYRDRGDRDFIEIGRVASSAGIPARLQLSTLVTRHSCIVGSTGSGKSNLVAVALEELSDGFPSARVLVVDPHGEYGAAAGRPARVIQTGASGEENRLRVPYWALPFDELIEMTMGGMQPRTLEALRDRVRDMKLDAAQHLADPPAPEAITADSPVPFSIRRLWFELEDRERMTFSSRNDQTEDTRLEPTDPGDMDTLRPPSYPPPTSYNTAPYRNQSAEGIGKQLDLLRMRLLDSSYAFMFDPDDSLHPDRDGRVEEDLANLLPEWVGGTEPITVLDVSGVPAEVVAPIVGTMLRIVYDALFWGMRLAVGGRRQPLLVILDEAHRFLPEGSDTPAHRAFSRIAKEGRKYGVGLMIVTQRPSDIDATVLSQCGTMLALRMTNPQDRGAVHGSIPDDLGDLTELLPSLRTGEALVLGDALQVPSRIRVRKAREKPEGEDPALPGAWLATPRPDPELYEQAVRNWRAQSTTVASTEGD